MADTDSLLLQCAPRIYDIQPGGSLTKLQVTPLTPKRLQELGTEGFGEAALLYANITRARASGVAENTLYDLFMSSASRTNVKAQIQKTALSSSKSLLVPYLLRQQKDTINANAFVISAGVATTDTSYLAADGKTNVICPAGYVYQISVKVTDSWLSSKITKLSRYFLPGETVVVMNVSASDKAAQTPLYRIISATDSTADTALVKLVPNVSTTEWGAYTNDQKAVFQPTSGVVFIGVNTVSDYEPWCHVQPVEDSSRLLAFWNQRSRYAYLHTDESDKFYDAILSGKINPYLQRFRELDISAQNKQMQAVYQRKHLISILFGEGLPGQDEATYRDTLEKVYDPKWGEFIEYKSNALGIRTLLARCGRVIDMKGGALDINAIEELLYSLKRYREGAAGDGRSVNEIDVWVNRSTFGAIRRIMQSYYQQMYGTYTQYVDQGKKLQFGERVTFDYDSYEMPTACLQLNVFCVEALSDFKTHFTGANSSRGNMMLFLDMSDIKVPIGEMSSRKSDNPKIDVDPEFACTIKANVRHVDMQSMLWTVLLESPQCHLWIENYDETICPTYTVKKCAVTVS